MGNMYSWATKEYCLYQMSLEQFMLYLLEGLKIKNPELEKQIDHSITDVNSMSYDELKAVRDQMRKTYGAIDGG